MVGGLWGVIQVDPNRLRGYGAVGGGSKMSLPITLASGLYNSLYYRTRRDLRQSINAVRTFNYIDGKLLAAAVKLQHYSV